MDACVPQASRDDWDTLHAELSLLSAILFVLRTNVLLAFNLHCVSLLPFIPICRNATISFLHAVALTERVWSEKTSSLTLPAKKHH